MNTAGGSLVRGSLLSAQGQSSFDVSKEADVIALLKAIHQNPIDPDSKNELRDLIFAYRSTLDPADLDLLGTALESVGIHIVQPGGASLPLHSEEKLTQPKGFSSAFSPRPMPRFAPPSAGAAKVTEPPVKKLVVSTQKQAMEPQAPQTSADGSVSQKSAAEDVSEVPQENTPVMQKISVEQTVPAPAQQRTNPSARIQEIKRLVNEKVGNPVNLISQNDVLGREYMNALLDAMKKSNGGQPGDIDAAMTRLETAFTQVMGMATSASTPAQASVPPITPPVTPVKASVQQSAAPTVPSYKGEEEQTEMARKPEPYAAPAPTPKPESVAPVANPVSFRDAVPLSSSQEASAVAPAVSMPKMSSVRDQLQNAEPKPQRASTAVPESSPDALPSVAKEKQVQDLLRLNRLKDAQSKKAQVETQISAMDPLQTPEVTSGLDQLLSEWALFKSSGIFGTGPSGNDHPLYKKIQALTMAAVIAGRFEGATPQIKQSITDYMNGWRYEEGIIHEHGETFEHYLRRVVKHILAKQKNR